MVRGTTTGYDAVYTHEKVPTASFQGRIALPTGFFKTREKVPTVSFQGRNHGFRCLFVPKIISRRGFENV